MVDLAAESPTVSLADQPWNCEESAERNTKNPYTLGTTHASSEIWQRLTRLPTELCMKHLHPVIERLAHLVRPVHTACTGEIRPSVPSGLRF